MSLLIRGPWHKIYYRATWTTPAYWAVVANMPAYHTVCRISNGWGFDEEAMASLIASVPEMVAELREMEHMLCQIWKHDVNNRPGQDVPKPERLARLETLIARAEGRDA